MILNFIEKTFGLYRYTMTTEVGMNSNHLERVGRLTKTVQHKHKGEWRKGHYPERITAIQIKLRN